MSTICKLNPRVRRERTDRRNIVRSLERVIVALPAGIQRVAAMVALDDLNVFKRLSYLTGTEKHELFNEVLAELNKSTTKEAA